MTEKLIPSRRAFVAAVAAAPIHSILPLAAQVTETDARLVLLGNQFDALAAQVDHAVNHVSDMDMDWDVVLDALGRVNAELVETQAATMEGLFVKARAACWALLGDLDPTDGSTMDRRMAVSIIRDLVRLHSPQLEQPGALKRLVADLD